MYLEGVETEKVASCAHGGINFEKINGHFDCYCEYINKIAIHFRLSPI